MEVKGGECREVKDNGYPNLFDMGLQAMGHILESFFEHQKKFRITE